MPHVGRLKPRRHHAPLARIVSQKINLADPEPLEFFRRPVKPVFTKRLAPAQFQVRAETPPDALQAETGVPLLDRIQARFAHNGRPVRSPVIRKTSLRIAL